jgi:elongation factor Ts
MGFTATDVKTLRDRTGAGMMDCKKALTETSGDMEKAINLLREKGLAGIAKRAGREAKEGLVESYIHAGGKVGVLIEVNCETDFVARNEDFRAMVKELALQVAASNPQYVRREDVPEEVVENERNIYRTLARNEGKPEAAIEKIVSGRVEKYYSEVCLLEQAAIREPKKKVGDMVTEVTARLGENVVVRRFTRYQVGEAA